VTPGPWEMREGKIVHYADSGTFIVCRYSDESPRHAADARLIAAAPDLLRACESALEKIARGVGLSHMVEAQLEEAIKKAKGL
jgi:hypothetical protein